MEDPRKHTPKPQPKKRSGIPKSRCSQPPCRWGTRRSRTLEDTLTEAAGWESERPTQPHPKTTTEKRSGIPKSGCSFPSRRWVTWQSQRLASMLEGTFGSRSSGKVTDMALWMICLEIKGAESGHTRPKMKLLKSGSASATKGPRGAEYSMGTGRTPLLKLPEA